MQPQSRLVIPGAFKEKLAFNVNYKIMDRLSVLGSFFFAPSYSFSLEYEHFALQSLSYTNNSTAEFAIKFKGTATPKESDSHSITFARVPLTSPTLISIWLDVSLVVSLSGEMSINYSVSFTENFSYKKGSDPFISKTKKVNGFDFDASVSMGVSLKAALVLNIGFTSGFSIDVMELYASIGIKASLHSSASYPDCGDYSVDGIFSVGIKLGLLSSSKGDDKSNLSVAFDQTIISLTWDIMDKHIETNPFQILNTCSRQKTYKVSLYTGTDHLVSSLSVAAGVAITTLSRPSRSGYTFTGWYTDALLTTPWNFADPVTSDMTLYAGWTLGEEKPLISEKESLPYLVYSIANDAVTITGYTGKPTMLAIPAQIEGYPVTKIAAHAFQRCHSLTHLYLPESITKLAGVSFGHCNNLSYVRLPTSWTTVSDYSTSPFAGCPSLAEITIPDGMTTIPSYAFRNMPALRSVSLPDSLTRIGDFYSFADCTSLTSIDIPDGVSIGAAIFENCTSLTDVHFGEGVALTGTGLFRGCTSLKSILMPDGITELKGSTFANCASLEYVTLLDSLTRILGNDFSGCASLQEITIPDTVTLIGQSAFANCDSLTHVTIPDSVITLESQAFSDCDKLSSVTLSSNWEYTSASNYRYSPFHNCPKLTSIVVPEGMTVLPIYAFSGIPNLKSVTLPSTLKTIRSYAFKDCDRLTFLFIPDNVSEIATDAFYGCDSLSSIRLPRSWTLIRDLISSLYSPFRSCPNFTTLVLSEGTTTLPSHTLHYMSSLVSIILPASFQSLSSITFDACTSLKYVYAYSTNYDYVSSFFATYYPAIEVRRIPGLHRAHFAVFARQSDRYAGKSPERLCLSEYPYDS